MDFLVLGLIALAVLYALSAFFTILRIGQPRDPYTPGEAAFTVFLAVLVIAILVGAIQRLS